MLAWEAFQSGSSPIGAVVLAPTGEVVASGRNRRGEVAGPVGQLFGTSLAHAEVNALTGLPCGNYSDHVLYTTLQPCSLCTTAVIHCSIGTVRYAAADPLWAGLEALPELNEHVARKWPTWDGPLTSPLSAWQVLCSALFQLRRSQDTPALRAHERHNPDIVRLARTITATGQAAELSRLPLSAAFERAISQLTGDEFAGPSDGTS
ncbi:nucleoside deaminase [Nonomuraea sp. NPDC005650]|uniref:nucleoside deaminase n=1 Tax=Nonomuraea sp. NPDC005650 TaxID=3157045 RepID=UPI0033BEAEFA